MHFPYDSSEATFPSDWYAAKRNCRLRRGSSRGLNLQSGSGALGRLSVKKIAKLTEPGRYGDGQCLYLQVAGFTNRSWIFRYERDGKERMLGLGPLHTFSLEEARERARLTRQQIKLGQDPLESRRTEKARRALEAARNKPFKECAEACFNDHSPAWKSTVHRPRQSQPKPRGV